jgi:hypothetical protein
MGRSMLRPYTRWRGEPRVGIAFQELRNMRELRPFELEVFFSKWEFTARHHLCASDMQSMIAVSRLHRDLGRAGAA